MFKKIGLIMSVVLIVTSLFSGVAFAEEDIKVFVNGEQVQFDVPPMMIRDRVMVPLRAIFEKLGATVEWVDEFQFARSFFVGNMTVVDIQENKLIVNGNALSLDVEPQVIDGRILVPVRAVAESMNSNVNWDESNNSVIITSKNTTGCLYDDNGNVYYEGELESEVPHGYGVLFHDDGKTPLFCGYFEYGEAIGSGYFYYDDYSLLYSGEVKGTRPNGYGNFYYPDKETVLVATFKDGEVVGTGEHHLIDTFALIYEGQFDENYNYSGEGSLYDSTSGELIYRGSFKNGLRDGMGTSYVNGKVYESGYFVEDMGPAEQENLLMQECMKEFEELDKWFEEQNEELLELINCDPYTTDWGREIKNKYRLTNNYASGSTIDASAAANAMRQQQALNEMADEEIERMHQQKIAALSKTIKSEYESRYNAIVAKYGLEE